MAQSRALLVTRSRNDRVATTAATSGRSGARQQVQQVSVRVREVEAAAVVPIVEFAILGVPAVAAVANAGSPNTLQNAIKFAIADVEAIVVALERGRVVEIKGGVGVHLDRSKVTLGSVVGEAETPRAEKGPRRPCRRPARCYGQG